MYVSLPLCVSVNMKNKQKSSVTSGRLRPDTEVPTCHTKMIAGLWQVNYRFGFNTQPFTVLLPRYVCHQ